MNSIRAFWFTLLILFLLHSAFADPTGRIRGKVNDPEGKPLEKVAIVIEAQGEVPQTYKTTTNSKGEYIHIGIKPGIYRVTPTKEGYVPVNYAYFELRISPSDKPAVADFVLRIKPQATATEQTPGEQPAQNVEAQKGMALLKSGSVDEAIAAFTKALEANPNSAAIHYNLALAYEKKEDREQARKHYQESIRIKPDLSQAYLALGNSYFSDRKYDEAIQALKKASELLPQDYEVFYNLGACYADTSKFNEAEAAFRKASEISPNEPIAHYQLGMALYGQSKNAEAKVEFQKYLELNPNAADKQDVEELIKSL